MTRVLHPLRIPIALLVLGLLAVPARGVLVYGPADAFRNLTTDGLSAEEERLWQLQGRFGGFLGTPIGPFHFLTAQHIGGAVGDSIDFPDGPNAGSRTTIAFYDDPDSDLRIAEVSIPFDDWADLYVDENEVGQIATLFGRGGRAGPLVVENGEDKGWAWGGDAGPLSWGRNVLTSEEANHTVRFEFDAAVLPNEGALTTGDSAGALFLFDPVDGRWELAGIHLGVQSPFQRNAAGMPDGDPFNASLFDTGGFWFGATANAAWISEKIADVPAWSASTRTSTRCVWIEDVLSIAGLCPPPPLDTDDDGVPDADDNCPYMPNVQQFDTGGVGSDQPDGIGNDCQCGDVTGDGEADGIDAIMVKRWSLGLSAPLYNRPELCDVNGDGDCDGIDSILTKRASLGLSAPGFGQHCPAAQP